MTWRGQQGAIIKAFLQRFGTFVLGVLSGFDKMSFRGCKRHLCHPGGLFNFLCQVGVLLMESKAYAKATTNARCKAIERAAKERGLHRYLNNSKASKEEAALNLAKEQGQTQGLIAVLGCVEPCRIMQVRGQVIRVLLIDFAPQRHRQGLKRPNELLKRR